MMNIYATRDDTVPFDGTPASDGFLYTPTTEVMDLWASDASQGCSQRSEPLPDFEGWCRRASGASSAADCATGVELVDCAWDGGHDWPRSGKTEFASDVIWEFFERNPRVPDSEVFEIRLDGGRSSPPDRRAAHGFLVVDGQRRGHGVEQQKPQPSLRDRQRLSQRDP